MKINIIEMNGVKRIVPTRKFANGDWFKCRSCEYTVRMLVLGNTATCSQCGGRMDRI